MGNLLAALVLVVQGFVLSASAAVDRDRVAVGEEITFTVSGTSDGSGTLTLITPSFDGFTIVRRSERREVAVTGRRTQVWEFQLKATAAGQRQLGPVQVVQGGVVAQTSVVDVEVVAEGTGLVAQLNPRLREMLLAVPPPPDSGAQITVLTSTPSAVIGQQVDVVTLAWFPRELRLRLRRQPTLEPPTFTGVWNYPQAVPPGIIATKRVGDAWFDLFVYHQVVYPITPGQVVGTPAVLRFSVPLAFQFFSQEERYELKSAIPRLNALPLPDDGRPTGFDGAVGSGITVTREVDGPPRTGEPIGVRFVLSGRGNVALWPPPFIRWPTGLQVYPEGTDEKLDAVGGVLGGTKTFRYLVVPDSSGALPIPSVAYHYFDPEPATYQTAVAAGVRIPVAPALTPVASRAEPPPMMLASSPPPSWQIAHALPAWLWVILWLAPAVAYGVTLIPRRTQAVAGRTERIPPWLEAQRQLETVMNALGIEGGAEPVMLMRALRGAGADAALAERVVSVQGKLSAERFAPSGGGTSSALLAEARTTSAALARLARRGRVRNARALGVALILLVAARSDGQGIPAERLYETGAFHAAMDAYMMRAATAPAVVGNWYGAGAAAYRLGEDGTAAAAWTRAARLAPRSRSLARALLLVPAPDPNTALWRGVWPVTAEELFLGATLLWFATWIGVGISRQWRGRWIVVACGAGLTLVAAGWLAGEDASPLGLVAVAAPLRVSPHGRAPGSRDLPVGTAVRPELHRADWTLVHAATGEVGWIPTAQVAWVRE